MLYPFWNIENVFGKSIYMFQPYLSDAKNMLVIAIECNAGGKLLLFCSFVALEL